MRGEKTSTSPQGCGRAERCWIGLSRELEVLACAAKAPFAWPSGWGIGRGTREETAGGFGEQAPKRAHLPPKITLFASRCR